MCSGDEAGDHVTSLAGLVNIGNTCYLNAALQLLCSADMFREVRLGEVF